MKITIENLKARYESFIEIISAEYKSFPEKFQARYQSMRGIVKNGYESYPDKFSERYGAYSEIIRTSNRSFPQNLRAWYRSVKALPEVFKGGHKSLPTMLALSVCLAGCLCWVTVAAAGRQQAVPNRTALNTNSRQYLLNDRFAGSSRHIYVQPVATAPPANVVVAVAPVISKPANVVVVAAPVISKPANVVVAAAPVISKPAAKPALKRKVAYNPTDTESQASRGNNQGIVGTAGRFMGVPYVYGGNSPRGFDCSGFTQYVFGLNGIQLPRVASAQAGVGRSVTALAPGDLVFFGGSSIYHVGIYIGGNSYIHAGHSGICVESLSDSWSSSRYAGARRI
jgi:cell wall-associated NlpC family hydrolase